MASLRTTSRQSRALSALALVLCGTAWSQDPVFTQFDNNPLHLNPAFTGDHCWRAVMNSRTQWNQLSGRYQTSSASVDHGFSNWGIGVQAMYDGGAAYSFQDLSISGLLSYRTRVGRTLWSSIGFRYSYHQRNIDPNKMLFRDQIETAGGQGFIYNTKEDLFATRIHGTDLGLGLLVYEAGIWSLGFSADHVADRDDSYDAFSQERWWIPRRITGHASLFFRISKLGRLNVRPAVNVNPIFQMSWQAGFWERNLTLKLNRGLAVIGFGYRFQNAYVLLAGVETDRFGVNVSTDITTARTLTDLPYTYGSQAPVGIVQPFTIEASLQWRIRCSQEQRPRKGVPCPEIWGEHVRPPRTSDTKGNKGAPTPAAGDSHFKDNVVPEAPR